ncbi:MAG: type II toxin-antitoxin system Phd/YefM family antitoxin [Candidatus Latescibacterota bacterium]|nr:type II toxin-antitoxin system Phd/YefM family antitoxin [Candidatus Latescibacterota bacterium]
MEKMLSIAEARRALSRLPDYFTQTPDVGALAITRRGQPVLAVLSWPQYEALVETLDILGDEEQTARLRRAVGRVRSAGGVVVVQGQPHREAERGRRAARRLLRRAVRGRGARAPRAPRADRHARRAADGA